MAEILGQPVNMTEIALWEIALVNKFNFTPEYRGSIGLGNLGTNLICIKWHTPITGLYTWQGP